MGEHTYARPHRHIMQPSMCHLNDIQVRFSLHDNTCPHHNCTPARTVMVSNAYGCETLIGGSPYPGSCISEVHTKSGFVSEQYLLGSSHPTPI